MTRSHLIDKMYGEPEYPVQLELDLGLAPMASLEGLVPVLLTGEVKEREWPQILEPGYWDYCSHVYVGRENVAYGDTGWCLLEVERTELDDLADLARLYGLRIEKPADGVYTDRCTARIEVERGRVANVGAYC